jgi:2-keto-4-pentenoate hydratase/2-oxohepta-3-ene-1,7-dioic acid hydratase in catechol pathway
VKIARFTFAGNTRLGAVIGDEIADLGGQDATLPADVGSLLAHSSVARLEGLVSKAKRHPLSAVRLESPIAQPPEFLAIGLNYAAHVAESKAGPNKPKVPMVFNKQATCITGPFDPIHIPHAAPDNIDYEGELGVVIGRRCRAVPRGRAHEVVAGWVVVNDVSVRDWQHASATFTMGKSWDTHGPVGPWMVTADELGDPHDLEVSTWVDGELRQHARTSQMLNNTWELIEHISTAFTLLPGTIIATGTPAGVGYAMEPKGLLKPGSVVKITIEGVGTIENTCIAEPNPGTVIA